MEQLTDSQIDELCTKDIQNYNKIRYIRLRDASFRCTCCGSEPTEHLVRLVVYNGKVMCEQCKEGLRLSETENV